MKNQQILSLGLLTLVGCIPMAQTTNPAPTAAPRPAAEAPKNPILGTVNGVQIRQNDLDPDVILDEDREEFEDKHPAGDDEKDFLF